MSWTGLPEFADDTNTDYIRPSPSIESNLNDLQNSNSSVSEHGESSSTILSKPIIKFVKAADSPGVIKTNKTARKPPVKYAEMCRNTSKSPNVRGNQRNWNNLKSQQLGKEFLMKNKAWFKCGHFDHLAYDCGVWVKKGKNWSKNNFAHKNVTPRADLFKTASVSVARRVNTAAPRPNVNCTRPKTTQDLVIIKLIQRVKRLKGELKARTPPTKIQKADVRGRSREIAKDGKVIGKGIRKKGLYVMKLGNKTKDKFCLATIDENSTLWHRRIGHANMCLIQLLASKKLVRNLPTLKFDQHLCDACKIRKQAHASHKAKNIVSTTRGLELLHMDLFGPSAVWSYRGNHYTLAIVDDYSRYTWIRFLKDKTEAFD
nr:retrovirus-related Pol polyprotein from transposon TNT 1-94 [Tanacetum cinerariifolium]